MSKYLSQTIKGFQHKPCVSTVVGPAGSGKTTWASSHPSPMFADLEMRSGHVDVERVTREQLGNFQGLLEFVKELVNEKHDYKTFVVDSCESLEFMIHEEICKKKNVTSISAIPYGGGYDEARTMIKDFMHLLQQLRDKRGMEIVLVGHTQIKTITDPALGISFDRFMMRTNDKFASVIIDLSDNVFFLTHKYDFFKTGKSDKVTTVGDNQRVLLTEYRPSHEGKNILNLPYEILLPKEKGYDALKAAIENAKPKSADEILDQIIALKKMIKDEKFLKALDEKLGKNPDQTELGNILRLVKNQAGA